MVSATTVSGAAVGWVDDAEGVGVTGVVVDFVVDFGVDVDEEDGLGLGVEVPELDGGGDEGGGLEGACTVTVPDPLIQLGALGHVP